jgi:hypothetical protein
MKINFLAYEILCGACEKYIFLPMKFYARAYGNLRACL